MLLKKYEHYRNGSIENNTKPMNTREREVSPFYGSKCKDSSSPLETPGLLLSTAMYCKILNLYKKNLQ